jgi:hypothetical protein
MTRQPAEHNASPNAACDTNQRSIMLHPMPQAPRPSPKGCPRSLGPGVFPPNRSSTQGLRVSIRSGSFPRPDLANRTLAQILIHPRTVWPMAPGPEDLGHPLSPFMVIVDSGVRLELRAGHRIHERDRVTGIDLTVGVGVVAPADVVDWQISIGTVAGLQTREVSQVGIAVCVVIAEQFTVTLSNLKDQPDLRRRVGGSFIPSGKPTYTS